MCGARTSIFGLPKQRPLNFPPVLGLLLWVSWNPRCLYKTMKNKKIKKIKLRPDSGLLLWVSWNPRCLRECVLFIVTRFSNLYTSVDTPAEVYVYMCI